MKKLATFTLIPVCALSAVSLTSSQVARKSGVADPSYLEYKGRLTDPSGANLTGEYDLVFRIFDSFSSLTALWEETHSVMVQDGQFEATLGRLAPLPSSRLSSCYLGISIDGEELSPRHLITGGGITSEDAGLALGVVPYPPIPLSFDNLYVNTSGPDSVTAASASWPPALLVRNRTTSSSALYGGYDYARNDGSGDAYGSYGWAQSTASGIAYGGVFGSSYGGTGNHFGVYGWASGDQSGAACVGSYGSGLNSSSGDAYGGVFQAPISGTGVHRGLQAAAWGAATTATMGAQGIGDNGSTGDVYGLYGIGQGTTTGNAYGGYFSNSVTGAGTHYGSYSIAGSVSSHDTYGAFGRSSASSSGNAYGLYGWADAVAGSSGDVYGVYGYVQGVGTSYGDFIGGKFRAPGGGTTANQYGVIASASNYTANYAYGVRGYAENSATGPATAGDFSVSSSGSGAHFGVYSYELAGGSGAAIYAAGDLLASGAKPAVVKTSSGHRLLYAQESPEVWFEDFGEGRFTGGRAHIDLDPLFLETVTITSEHPMTVFVQLTSGEPVPVVVEKGTSGFDLRIQDARSAATFDYRVVAKRKGFETERLRETDVGYDDPNLYPELLDEKERRFASERQNDEMLRGKSEAEEMRRKENQRLEEVKQLPDELSRANGPNPRFVR